MEPLEQIAQAKTAAACALITTYERDSIWHNEGLVSVTPADIEALRNQDQRSRGRYQWRN
jgi:hypothetical protein